jgi:phenylalanyl-tRNA synthetase alpha subunit
MKKGQPKNSTAGQKGMSEKLARLAAQQEAIRNEMSKYADQLNEQGIKDGGALNDMMKKMDETQKELVNRKIVQETLNRQQEILTRMLESEKAEMKRGQEEKRQSTEAKNPKISNPFSNLKYNNTKTAGTDLLKLVQPSYNYFYKNKINSYFLKFE